MTPEAAVPMIARNAAFLVLASKFPNSDIVYSEDFARALYEALEAAAPFMLAPAWDEGYEKGALSQFEEPSNPYRPTE